MDMSEIFAKAADEIEMDNAIGICCCPAIKRIEQHGDDGDALRFFQDTFSDGRTPFIAYGWWGDCSKRKNQDARILALCFASAIAKSEGK